jgi:hypothetical protein
MNGRGEVPCSCRAVGKIHARESLAYMLPDILPSRDTYLYLA